MPYKRLRITQDCDIETLCKRLYNYTAYLEDADMDVIVNVLLRDNNHAHICLHSLRTTYDLGTSLFVPSSLYTQFPFLFNSYPIKQPYGS